MTLGAGGMTLVHQSGARHEHARAREVAGVSGAGDTVIAVLGAMMAAGASTEEAMRIANVAAGIVVGKLGTATVSREELRQALAEGH